MKWFLLVVCGAMTISAVEKLFGLAIGFFPERTPIVEAIDVMLLAVVVGWGIHLFITLE